MKALFYPTTIAFVAGGFFLAVADLPLDDFAKLGATGCLCILLIWLIAKTIPGLVASHNESLKDLAAVHTSTIKDLVTSANSSINVIKLASDANATEVRAGFSRVESAFKEVGDQQVTLLRELVSQRKA